MAQETGFVRRTLAKVGTDAIMARTTVEARLLSTIIDVDLTAMAFIAIYTDALIASFRVGARRAVLTNARPQCALVHVLGTVATCVFWGAAAGVGVYSVNALASILTQVSRAVINVDVAS